MDHESFYDTEINKKHDWIKNLDYDSFSAEVASLGKELQLSSGQEDMDHLEKVLRWRDIVVLFLPTGGTDTVIFNLTLSSHPPSSPSLHNPLDVNELNIDHYSQDDDWTM